MANITVSFSTAESIRWYSWIFKFFNECFERSWGKKTS